VACRGNTSSFDTFADANSEARIAGTEHLFVKRERDGERKGSCVMSFLHCKRCKRLQ
jgi:hypothetical protein